MIFCGMMRDAVGFRKISIEKPDPRIPSKKLNFWTGYADRIAQSNTVRIKKILFTGVLTKADFVSDQKPNCSVHVSDCT